MMTEQVETPFCIGVERVTEHEDGSATYTFQMDNKTRDMLVDDGIRLVLMCVVAGIRVEEAFDMIHNLVKEKLDE
jgi:hypothetical protein